MPNLHSHAFQRAMAGAPSASSQASFVLVLAQVMYRFLERIGPDALRAFASQLYVEMLEAGYTAVGEFHYLHHQVDGSAFADPAELSWAILEAQRASGIGLTHLPALYMAGGFGGARPRSGQRRFVHDLDRFADLIERLKPASPRTRTCASASRPHSLRAVPDEALRDVVALADAVDAEAPIHIHVAEQVKEVRDCLEWCGARPVRHLFDAAPVGPRWCLIRATTGRFRDRDAGASGAVAGLCPTTEANLGDGLFDLGGYLTARGAFGIGSDSHVSISPIEELRWLEYGQRLGTLRRLIGASAEQPHCGARLWRGRARRRRAGARAQDRPPGAGLPRGSDRHR